MGAYRAGDLLTVPGLLSLARVPLGLLFPFVVDPWASLLVVATAGLSDMLDGWYARRFGKETATGALLDPLSDKFFVAAMVLTLLLRGGATVVGRARAGGTRDRRGTAGAVVAGD